MSLLRAVLLASASLFVISTSAPAHAETATVTPIQVEPIPLGSVTFPGGKTRDWTVGIGSAAFHAPSDPADIFYTMTDRGPNIDCAKAEEPTGLSTGKMCNGDKKAKIFPIPAFQPQIMKFKLSGNKAELLETIKLKGKSGKPITGLTNGLKVTDTEDSYSNEGKRLDYTANGLDTEGLAKMKDGSFWIGEEYGGSIAHVAADGTLLTRYVPAGMEADLADADYEVKGVLPAIIMKRKLNRGIESMAVSSDEAFLYFMMQSPLANPNSDAYKKSANVRVFKFDIKAENVVGEWLYVMDDATTFKADNVKKARKQNDVKISELTSIADDKLLVLERIAKTTRLYLIDLANAAKIPAQFDDAATSPTLARIKTEAFEAEGLMPLKKTLVLDTDTLPAKPINKVEGIAVLNERELILVNDNDFGLGGKTEMAKVTLAKPILDTGK